jgi:hypothetical protein
MLLSQVFETLAIITAAQARVLTRLMLMMDPNDGYFLSSACGVKPSQ